MPLIVKESSENTIYLPAELMSELNLRDGDEVKALIEGQTLRLAPLESFLALRGALADDEDFDAAINSLNQEWQLWTTPPSA